MTYEEEFASALRAIADRAPEPPGETLALASERRGRRRRLRRRAVVTGAVAVVVLAGVTVSTLPGRAGGQGPAGGMSPEITGRFMTDTFKALLPAGRVTVDAGYGAGDRGAGQGPLAVLEFDDGQGAAQLDLSAERVGVPITAATQGTQCIGSVDYPTELCNRVVRSDGSILMVQKFLPRAPDWTRRWWVVYTAPDGRQVQVNELARGSAERPARQVLPVSTQWLTDVVASSVWDPVFGAVTQATASPPAPGTVADPPAAAELRTALRGLLPAGAQARDAGAADVPGSTLLSVTLADRTSNVGIDVMPGSESGDPERRTAFTKDVDPASVVRSEDGTLTVARTYGASKSAAEPVVQWVVEALRPDGTLVAVSEWNGTDPAAPVPGTPALTVDQLRAIAFGARWSG
ncbi:hypothetical protein [Kitasatospora sp. HPMI-4]|uniref:hypothetical protein n=1 Tax=Kitasatospora sp. HPMI-4 TaxID=3448443 RepID=UPI003F1ACDCF